MSREHRRRLVTSASLALALLLPSAAPGQDAEPDPPPPEAGPVSGPGSGACHADVQRFCSAAKGTPRGVATCLRDHHDELSEPCREQMQRMGKRMRGAGARVRAQCQDELERFCADVQPGGGGLMRCLRSHDSELSDGCREALPDRPRGGGPGGGRRGPP